MDWTRMPKVKPYAMAAKTVDKLSKDETPWRMPNLLLSARISSE